MNPFFKLRGISNTASFLSGIVDRGRQNQYMYDQYSSLGQLDALPLSDFQPVNNNMYFADGGSIVDYAKASGRDASFSSRKQLAEQLGISAYKGTSDQNMQLLSMLRDQDSQAQYTDDNAEHMESPETVQARLQDIQNKYRGYQTPKVTQVNPTRVSVAQRPTAQVAPSTETQKVQLQQGKATAPSTYDIKPVKFDSLTSAYDQYKGMKDIPQQAPKKVEPWYKRVANSFDQMVKDSGLKSPNLGAANPAGSIVAARSAASSVLKMVDKDLSDKFENKIKRVDAMNNLSNERKSSIKQSDMPYITGDTIKDGNRRYHIPEIIDLNNTKFGTRNRGDYNEISTEGAPITAFKPFTKASEYFKNSKDDPNSTYIGVNKDGELKTGRREDFKDGEYSISKTFSNKVVSFNRDKDGKILKVPSNPNASKNTLSPSIKVIGDDGKMVDGRLSLLMNKDGEQEKSFDLVTGGRYILESPDGKTRKLVSGSLSNIESEFNKMKKGNQYVNVITLDNGSYSRGIRTYDQKLTKKDLRGYDNQNTEGGNIAYILSRQGNSEQKFKEFENNATNVLKGIYPKSKVEVRYQNEGLYGSKGERDVETQYDIAKKGNSQSPISLHNFNAARDYDLYVDGKRIDPAKNKDLYKKVLWGAADKSGTYHLEDWDPTHISLAKEGQKTAFDELASKYPDIFKNPNSKKTLAFLEKHKGDSSYAELYRLAKNIKPFNPRGNKDTRTTSK